jgi:hypothetical protein
MGVPSSKGETMVKEDQSQPGNKEMAEKIRFSHFPFTTSKRRSRREGRISRLLAAVLTVLAVLTACGFFLVPRPSSAPPAQESGQQTNQPSPINPTLFRNWPKPDLALVLSGQQYGYLQPCGCSEPQKGGLARRYNFVEALKKRGWALALGDLGDISEKSGPQAKLKYAYSMRALKILGYTAVSFGENEISLGLFDTLGQYAVNESSPRIVAANLNDKSNKFPGMVADFELTSPKNGEPKVAFIGAIAPSVAKLAQQPDVAFDPIKKALPEALAAVQKQGAEILVLLLQGNEDEVKDIAKKFPQFHVILYPSEAEEPSSRPDVAGNTYIASVGHKGRYMGVVGIRRTGQAAPRFEMRYQLVAMDPEFESPEGQDAQNPIHKLMQEYALEVRNGNYLAKYPQGPHPIQISFPGSAYVGSEKCKKCHQSAYDIWAKHPHSHAYETLVSKAKRPTLRQFDGECIKCHVTGFGYKTGFTSVEATPKLKNVGCESCHGPCSEHALNPNDTKLQALINPDKTRKGEDKNHHLNRMNDSCMKCHDQDNSVNFHIEEYWVKKNTEHYTKDE